MVKVPARRCVACRKSGEKRGLLRLVLGSGGVVCPDEAQNRPGRGAYVHRRPECLLASSDAGKLAHAFRVDRSAVDIGRWQKTLEEFLRQL